MNKTIILNQDSLIKIKESMVGTDDVSHTLVCVNEARPEVDEFELGQESDNPPVGGNFCHVEETVNEGYCHSKLKNIDLSDVGKVECECDFDEDEYNEWLVDNELTDSQEVRIQYYTENVTYDVTYLDNETYHTMEYDSVYYDDLEELFGEKMAETILSGCMKNGKYDFETYELYADNTYDLSNPQEVNDIAMKLFSHGEYYKDCRGFILSNGVIVYTPSEHNEICMIPGVDSKFKFIEMGNIRLLPNSIDIGAEPTYEQEEVLREVIASYSEEELYLDIFDGNSEIGAKYTNPDWRYVIGEIDRYYSEGIRPQGDNGRYYMMDENVEVEVKPNEVDLSSFKKKDELVPSVWKDGVLDSRIRLKLLDIADDFWEFVNLKWVQPNGIILTGSICNFNWSKFSDIDLHLIVDFDEIDEKTEFVRDYLDAKKNEWNNEHEGLRIMGFNVELYVQDLGEMPKSGGIYDLEENDWIKRPDKDAIKSIGLNKYSIKDKAADIMTIIDDMYDALNSTDDSHEIEEIGNDAKYLCSKIKDMRKSSLDSDGESGSGNIVYKILRRTHYLDKLWKLSTIVYDRSNSINESVDGNTDMFKLAIEHFGTTNDIRECGYILPDGTMLDFSGRYMIKNGSDSSHLSGRRGVDHRNIYEIGWSEDGNTKNFDIKMEDFIRLGAIRIHASKTYALINLYKKPTPKQVPLLVRLIQYAKGCVDVEIGDGDESLSYGEFDNEKPSVVIAKINRFFDEKINLNESKELLREYLDKNYNAPLYHYFKWAKDASDEEKVSDIIYQCSYEAKKYISKMANQVEDFEPLRLEIAKDEEIIYDDEFVEKVANVIVSNGLMDAFIYYLEVTGNQYEMPSWVFMDFNRVVKNEWCIHFGADSNSIAREGFTGGTEEIERLAYTGAGREKRGAGYDFAFPLGERDVDNNNYGNEAVIFQTSGIEIYHYGDSQNQVVFWGPYAKNFIPIRWSSEQGEWVVEGSNGQILKAGKPSEIAYWAVDNLPQYRKQIMAGKNGYIPSHYDYNEKKVVPYPLYRNESVKKYLTLLKEEWVGDGNSEHNPYKERWDAERKALKDFLANYGKLMQSRENGNLYKVYYDKTLSELIGYNYCICIQWDSVEMKPKSVLYIRALDKFTPNIKKVNFDTRGRDNQRGTYDDLSYQQRVESKEDRKSVV